MFDPELQYSIVKQDRLRLDARVERHRRIWQSDEQTTSMPAASPPALEVLRQPEPVPVAVAADCCEVAAS